MLYAGLDLSRKRLDVCVLDEDGTELLVTAVAPDADALRTLTARVARQQPEPVTAAIESMTGARFVHDQLERWGWEVDVAFADVLNLRPGLLRLNVDHRRLTQPHMRSTEVAAVARRSVCMKRPMPLLSGVVTSQWWPGPVPLAQRAPSALRPGWGTRSREPRVLREKPGHQQLRRVGGPQESNVADLLAIDGLEVHIADQPQNAEPLPVSGH